MNKRKVIGLCIVLLGIIFAVCLIVSQYVHCIDMWVNEGKHSDFLTAADYFFEVSTGTILISGLTVLLSSILGIGICCTKTLFDCFRQ